MEKVKCLSKCLRKKYVLCLLRCVYVKTPHVVTDNFIYSFTGRRNYYFLGVVYCYCDRVLQEEANGFGDAGGVQLKSFRIHFLARSVRVSESLLAVSAQFRCTDDDVDRVAFDIVLQAFACHWLAVFLIGSSDEW